MKRLWRWAKPGRAIWEFYKKKISISLHIWTCERDPVPWPWRESPQRGQCCRDPTEALQRRDMQTHHRCPVVLADEEKDLVPLRRTSCSLKHPPAWPTGCSGHTWEAQRSRSRSRRHSPPLSNARRSKQKHRAGPFGAFNQKWSHPSRSGLCG